MAKIIKFPVQNLDDSRLTVEEDRINAILDKVDSQLKEAQIISTEICALFTAIE